MAAGNLEVFAEGNTTLAVGSWTIASSGAPGAGFVDDCNLAIQTPGDQEITGSLDWSGLGVVDPQDGPYALDVLAPFAGHIGTAAAGPLIVAVAGDAYSESAQNSRIRYWAAGGSMRWSGGAGGAQLVQVGGAGKFFAMAGYITYLMQEGGELNVNSAVTFTDAGRISLMGGTSFIDTHATDLIGQATYGGGTHTLKRGGIATNGVLRVESGARLTLDCGAAAWPLVIVSGGQLTWLSAAAPGTTAAAGGGTANVLGNEANVEFRSGLVDFTRMTRPVSITARTYPACTIRGANNPLLTLTNLKQGSGAVLG